MIIFPNCKINLGLHIVGKRPDGFHDIETAFFPIPLTDILEAVPASSDQFTVLGNSIPGKKEDNLCLRALEMLRQDYPGISPLDIYLYKAIPTGGGLGGGSSDGAFMIKLLDQLFNLGLDYSKQVEYALRLGSDCPFFILNKPCIARGRGEILEPLPIDLSEYSFLLVNPGINISTRWAFGGIKPATPTIPLSYILSQPPGTWKETLKNDFEPFVFEAYPELAAIRDTLYYSGAIYAAMSGSGSTLFGIFRKKQLPALFHDKPYLVREID